MTPQAVQAVPVSPESTPRPQPVQVPSPTQAALQALEHTKTTAMLTNQAVDKLVRLIERHNEPPEFHTIAINDGNTGRYTVLSRSRFEAKSIGVINPTSVAVYVGLGHSATAAARAVPVAPQSMLTLPVLAQDVELGCDPSALGGSTAVVYLFRFLTVQPLVIQLLH